MNVWTVLVLVVIGIAGAIFVGGKAKAHYGMAAIAFAYVIGSWILGIGTGTLVNYFPIRVVFTIIGTTYFYGYAVSNGTISVIADRIVYAGRNIPWAIMIFLAAATWSIGALGATAATAVMLMGPVGYMIAKKANIHPMLAVTVVGEFACAGNMMPWSSIGVIYRGLAEAALTPEDAYTASVGQALALLVGVTLVCAVVYFLLKGHKAEKITMDKPEPITPKQKATLVLVFAILALTILPRVIGTVFGVSSPILTWLNTYMDLQFLGILGGLICAILKLGDDKEAMNNIPWSLVMLISGFAILMGVAVECGVAVAVSEFIASNCPVALVTPLFHLIGGAMSFVMTGATVVQTFTPFIPAIATSTGLNAAVLWAALTMGTNITGMSPFSMGGSFILGLCPDKELQKKLFGWQVILAIIPVVVFTALAFVGYFSWFC